MPEHPDVGADQLALGVEVESEHRSRAAGDRQQPGTHPQQRGLAGAVRTAQEHDLVGGDTEVGAGKRRERPEDGDDVIEHDHVVSGARHAPGRRRRPEPAWRQRPATISAINSPASVGF